MFPVAVARQCDTYYVMYFRFCRWRHILHNTANGRTTRMFRGVCHKASPEAKSTVSDCMFNKKLSCCSETARHSESFANCTKLILGHMTTVTVCETLIPCICDSDCQVLQTKSSVQCYQQLTVTRGWQHARDNENPKTEKSGIWGIGLRQEGTLSIENKQIYTYHRCDRCTNRLTIVQ